LCFNIEGKAKKGENNIHSERKDETITTSIASAAAAKKD
jgi:hypothetical protein